MVSTTSFVSDNYQFSNALVLMIGVKKLILSDRFNCVCLSAKNQLFFAFFLILAIARVLQSSTRLFLM